MISRLIHFQALGLAVGLSFASWGMDGRNCLEQRMPLFLRALETAATETQSQALLRHWTKADCYRLERHWSFIHAVIAKSKHSSPEVLFTSHGHGMIGILGELYGIAELRSRLDYEQGERIIGDDQYDPLNLYGNRPDGIVYRIENGKLHIKQLLESKMGSSGFLRSQAEGYLKVWKTSGVNLPWADRSWFFAPSFITIGGKEIAGLTVDDIIPDTVLVSSSRKRFAGELLIPPVMTTEARDTVLLYLTHLLGASPLESVRPSAQTQKSRPQIRSVSHKIAVPTAEEMPEFQAALVDFLYQRKHWPKGGSTCAIERYLAREVAALGGQSSAFLFVLGGGERHYLQMLNLLPSRGSLAATLARNSPTDPRVISGLRAFLMTYEPGQNPPVFAQLRRGSPDWQEFLERTTAAQLAYSDLNEVGACLHQILLRSFPKQHNSF